MDKERYRRNHSRLRYEWSTQAKNKCWDVLKSNRESPSHGQTPTRVPESYGVSDPYKMIRWTKSFMENVTLQNAIANPATNPMWLRTTRYPRCRAGATSLRHVVSDGSVQRLDSCSPLVHWDRCRRNGNSKPAENAANNHHSIRSRPRCSGLQCGAETNDKHSDQSGIFPSKAVTRGVTKEDVTKPGPKVVYCSDEALRSGLAFISIC